MSEMNKPASRVEAILQRMLGADINIENPASRVEFLLSDIKDLLLAVEAKALYRHNISFIWREDEQLLCVLKTNIINDVDTSYTINNVYSIKSKLNKIGVFNSDNKMVYSIIKESSNNSLFDISLLQIIGDTIEVTETYFGSACSITDNVERLI